jgi:hypothetical protein
MEDTQNEQVVPSEVETDETVTESETQEAKPAEEQIVIPDNWDQGLKDFIGGINDNAGKRAIVDKVTNLERGYNDKYQNLAKERQAYESEKKAFDENRALFDSYSAVDKGLDPEMKPQIIAQYGSVANYMNALHQMDIVASRDPVRFLQNYCANNGISAENLAQILSGEGYRQAQANVYQQQRTNDQEALKAQIMRELEAKQQQEAYKNQVLAFVQAKDANGQDLHPLMSDQSFVSDMERLQGAFPDKSLEDLYQMAVNMRPDLRQKAIDDEAKKITEAKEVEKAKSAVGVKPQIPTHGAKPSKGWGQVLDEELDKFTSDE